MKKYSSFAILLFAMCVALFTSVLPVHAYDPETWEVSPENEYIVTNEIHESATNHVTIYMYTANDKVRLSQPEFYSFYCKEGDFPGDRTFGSFLFKFRPENKKVISTLADGEVWVWTFSLENGKYVFCSSDAEGINQKYTLSSEGTILPYTDEIVEEVVELNGNDKTTLYVLNGDKNWAPEHVEEFWDWVNKKEIDDAEMTGKTETKETITVIVPYDPEPEPEPVVIPEAETPVVEEKETDWGILIKGGIAFAVLVILGFIIGKKK